MINLKEATEGRVVIPGKASREEIEAAREAVEGGDLICIDWEVEGAPGKKRTLQTTLVFRRNGREKEKVPVKKE